MFKKYKGFSSRFKLPDKVEDNSGNINLKDSIEIPEPEKEKTGQNKNLTWPKIQKDDNFASKSNLKSLFKIKKKFVFPDLSKSTFDTYSAAGKILNFIKSKIRMHKPAFFGILLGLIAAIILTFVFIIIIDYKKVKGLADFEPNITTNIYDKNSLLIAELFKQKREVVPLPKMPKDLINAFIAMEDNDFYKHNGLNFKGIVRAFFINIFSGKIKQGGSTITQQLAKILLTTSERNIFRKAKEATISLMIEMIYTKQEILNLYLNQIFLGHGVYGVESAARFYFNKHVWDLNLAECALLATLPSAPNKLSPIRHTELSIERHRIVLAKMVDCGFITIPAAERAYLEFWPDYIAYINELPPSITSWSNKVDRAPWFTEYIRQKLVKQFGVDAVYRDGLSVYTTLDLKKQEAAQRIMEDGLAKQASVSVGLSFKNEDYIIENFSELTELFSFLNNINPYYKKGSLDVKQVNDYAQSELLDELDSLSFLFTIDNISDLISTYREEQSGNKGSQKVEGCLVSIDQRNGYIEAMVGGAEFSSINQLNRVMQSKRQAGSAIKGLLYAAAMESKKFSPSTTILDAPLVYVDTEGLDWVPENYEERYYGLMSLRSALERSVNIISIKIAEVLGLSYIQEYYARLLKLGKDEKKERVPRNLSIALGSLDISPFELARAYAIIANGGRDVIPISIRYVKNRNGEITDKLEQEAQNTLKKEAENGSLQIISAEAAQIMISMLRSVMTSGTGLSAAIGRPSGGKTGTTNNWKDAWFVGFTPQLTTCVWAGYDNQGLSLGPGQTGAVVSAPLWAEYMREALKDELALDFPYYASLVTQKVCSVSGLLPSSYCKNTIDEIFIEGTVPESECEVCKDLKYNIDPQKTSPKENIAGDQRESILDQFKEKKDKSILKNIEKDLLE